MKKALLAILVSFALLNSHQTSPILIFGTCKKKAKEAPYRSECIICKAKDLKIYSIRSWFTLFFIAVVPIGEKKYYLKCTRCKNFYRPPDDIDIEEFLQQYEGKD